MPCRISRPEASEVSTIRATRGREAAAGPVFKSDMFSFYRASGCIQAYRPAYPLRQDFNCLVRGQSKGQTYQKTISMEVCGMPGFYTAVPIVVSVGAR